MQTGHDAAVEAAKLAPPAAVIGGHYIAGLTLNDWVLVLTIIYLLANLGLMIPKYRTQISKWRNDRKKGVGECRSRRE